MQTVTLNIYHKQEHLVDIACRRDQRFHAIYRAIAERHLLNAFVLMYQGEIVEFNATPNSLGMRANTRIDLREV